MPKIVLNKEWEYDGETYGPDTVLSVDADTAETLIDDDTADEYDEEAVLKAQADEKEQRRLIREEFEAQAKKSEKKRKTVVVESGDSPEDKLAKSEKGNFDNFGEFAHAVSKTDPKMGNWDEKLLKWNHAVGKVYSENIDSEGGFLVPTEFRRTLMEKAHQEAVLATDAFDIPMGGLAIQIPAVTDTDRGNDSRMGGMRGYWLAEAAQKTLSSGTFEQIELRLNKLAIIAYASDEVLADAAFSMGTILTRQASAELAFKIDDAIFRGTGAGMPLGVTGHASVVAVAKETGQPADTIVFENIVKMWSRMHASSLPGAKWYINQDIYPQLFQLSLGVGTGGSAVYLPPTGLASAPFGTLMGKPVIPFEQASTLGDLGDINFLDMRQYLLGRKASGVEAATSIHLRFDYDQTTFRFVARVDGKPWWRTTLTPYQGTGNTQSWGVQLAERA